MDLKKSIAAETVEEVIKGVILAKVKFCTEENKDLLIVFPNKQIFTIKIIAEEKNHGT